jgi:acetyl-CoA C-acetyltransferase
MPELLDAYVYDGARSAFGRHGGALASLRPDDLLAHVLSTLTRRNPFPGAAYEDVIIGNTNQAGEDCRNVARYAVLLAGLPGNVGGLTVNRLCGSGLAAVLDAARAVRCREGGLFVAGGVESMSRAPLILSKATTAYDRGQQLADSTLGARFTNPRFAAAFGHDTMPQTADNIARELGISRVDSDAYAALSQARYEAARLSGFFAGEILATEVPQGRKQPPRLVNQDEHPRPDSTLQATRKVLARANLQLSDMDVIEINEAFATQVLGCLRQLGLDFAYPRVNPNGGAIAVGHPLGASGARLALTAIRQLERTGGHYALVSLCIGFGQGIALILERVS